MNKTSIIYIFEIIQGLCTGNNQSLSKPKPKQHKMKQCTNIICEVSS